MADRPKSNIAQTRLQVVLASNSATPRRESELERGLMEHIQKFLLELGQGFVFVGQQVH